MAQSKSSSKPGRASAAAAKSGTTKQASKAKPAKLSRTIAPAELTPTEWQRGLRRQFGQTQEFTVQNLAGQAFFSEYLIRNNTAKSSYRINIRGAEVGDNTCTCMDFATNELGTCKHIEYLLALLLKKRGARNAFARGFSAPYSELYLRNDGVRTVHFRAGTDCPASILSAAQNLFDSKLNWQLPQARFAELDQFTQRLAQAGHELRAEERALDFVAGHLDAQRRREKLVRLFPNGAKDRSLTKLLQTRLYPYQAEGALFAVRAGRALIGDDMGLGKTIQAIAAMEILLRHFDVAKVLVICPTSLKYQWQSEIKRFVNRTAQVIAGGRSARQIAYAEEQFCKITNYEKLQPDLDLITAWSPELVIVDEAQRVKNWNTIAARALKRINSSYAVVLTGTPLENKLEELISIVQFVDQHRLGPTWKLLHEHQLKDESGRVIGYTGLDKIAHSLAPIFIRRRKSQVLLQLPSRTDQTLLLPMTEAQMIYHEENAEVVSKVVARWRRTGYLTEQDQRRLTCALQNMRMSCNSTYLLDQDTDHGVKADELVSLLTQLFAEAEAKAVVFSQWTRTHEIIIRRLQALGIGYVFFHGGIAAEKRPALVQQFKDDPKCRVFLSTDAGATGLNLQHASTLFNMDLPWNPALLEQRIGRIHRMGQKHPVRIINLVAKGTIEEGMQSVLSFKRALAGGILDGGTGEISLGGSRLNRFMKEVSQVTNQMGEAELMNAQEEENHAPQTATIREATTSTALDGNEQQPVPAKYSHTSDVIDAITTIEDSKASNYAQPSTEPMQTALLPANDPWQGLMQLGTQLLGALSAAGNAEANAGSTASAAQHPWLVREADSDVTQLRIPLPKPETLKLLGDALMQLAKRLGG